MENEKKIVDEKEPAEKVEVPSPDAVIDDIAEAQAPEKNAELQEVEFIPLDALLYESDDMDTVADDTDDSFESFFAEYRLLIAENLGAARKASEESENAVSEETSTTETPEPIAVEITKPATAKKKKSKASKTQEKSDWSGEITLAPEEYEPLDEENEIFIEEPEEEPEPIVDLIGEDDTISEEKPESVEDDIQISFFVEERTTNTKREIEEEEKKYDPENPRKIDTIFDFLELFIFTLVAVIILTSFVFKHSVVEGDSMNNTLSDGDHLIVWDAFYTPERYDIVVFEDYSTALKKPVVKRVIGLPGDTVEIKNGEDGVFLVYVNGELIEEEYAYHGIRYSKPETGVWTIGEGELFVLGDNRYNSTDSRDDRVGPINIDSLLGKVVLRFYPFKDFTTFN